MSAGSLTEQIAASIEDVKALLDDNRRLSVAFLARRIRDLEEETRKSFRRIESQLEVLQRANEKLHQRFDLAAVKFKEMRGELDKQKGP